MSLFFINTARRFIERFSMGRFMEFTDNYDPLTSAFLLQLPTLPEDGRIRLQGESKRADNISNDIYQDSQLWWMILFTNDIIDSSLIRGDALLKFPLASRFDDILFSLKAQDFARRR